MAGAALPSLGPTRVDIGPSEVARIVDLFRHGHRGLLLETDLLLQSAIAALVKADEAWRDPERARASELPPDAGSSE